MSQEKTVAELLTPEKAKETIELFTKLTLCAAELSCRLSEIKRAQEMAEGELAKVKHEFKRIQPQMARINRLMA